MRTPLDSISCAYMSHGLSLSVHSSHNVYITYCLPHCLCLCLFRSLSTLACCVNLAILKPSFIQTHAYALTHKHKLYSQQKPFQKRQNVNESLRVSAEKRKMIVNNSHEVNWLNARRVCVFAALLPCLRERMRM